MLVNLCLGFNQQSIVIIQNNFLFIKIKNKKNDADLRSQWCIVKANALAY